MTLPRSHIWKVEELGLNIAEFCLTEHTAFTFLSHNDVKHNFKGSLVQYKSGLKDKWCFAALKGFAKDGTYGLFYVGLTREIGSDKYIYQGVLLAKLIGSEKG